MHTAKCRYKALNGILTARDITTKVISRLRGKKGLPQSLWLRLFNPIRNSDVHVPMIQDKPVLMKWPSRLLIETALSSGCTCRNPDFNLEATSCSHRLSESTTPDKLGEFTCEAHLSFTASCHFICRAHLVHMGTWSVSKGVCKGLWQHVCCNAKHVTLRSTA